MWCSSRQTLLVLLNKYSARILWSDHPNEAGSKQDFYQLYKNTVPIILNSFNKVWDRWQHPDETTLLVSLLGWGLLLLCRILQGNNLYLNITKADKNDFFFNLNSILKADSIQLAAVIHNTGKRLPWGRYFSLIIPNITALNPCQ